MAAHDTVESVPTIAWNRCPSSVECAFVRPSVARQRAEGELKRVDTIARVRRAFHVQGWSMKRIARELHVSRNTVGSVAQIL